MSGLNNLGYFYLFPNEICSREIRKILEVVVFSYEMSDVVNRRLANGDHVQVTSK